MNKLEWGNTAHEKENIIILNGYSPRMKTSNSGDNTDIQKLIDNGLNGYIDGKRAFKILEPSSQAINEEFILKQHTIVRGDDTMADITDNGYSELKEDIRESERRIGLDIREREQRFEREAARREERFEKSLEKFAQDAKEREERYIKSVDEIKNIVSEGEKNRKSTSIAMWTLAITTIVGIAAMVVTVVLAT